MAENVFEAVKQSVSTREAAAFYGIEVKRNGMVCCPFHDDKNPSMKVDQRFHCFGCGADGDVIDFTAKLFDLSPKEAAEKLAQDFGLIYDSQAPPRRRYVRQKTEAQKFREDRQRCYRVLSDYYYLLAEKLWYLYHDLSEGAREAGYLSCLSEIKGNGFSEETRRLTEQLSDPAFRQTLKEEYAAFWTAYQQDRDLLRFHYHRPREIWENLKDLDLPRRTFSSDLSQVPTVQHFITEDEIDAAMTGGSSFAGGKGRIYAFFMANHTDKEKVRFLKDEYGIGGRSHALSGATHSGEDHDGKGLHYKKQDCPDVHLNWEKVAKRITSLVQKARYLTEQEQAQYDKIQSEQELAEEDAIQAQQPEMDEETPKPTLGEQFEQYKPVVTAAISEDTAYRNACGHSDRENAVIEGNAAVRRAVLGSKDKIGRAHV